MGIYLIVGLILSVVFGAFAKFVLDLQKKWVDTITFLWIGIVFGIVLLLFRNMLGYWYVNQWINISFGTIAYIYAYHSFYRDFKSKFPHVNIGFLKYVHLRASKTSIKVEEISAEAALSDAFSSDMRREIEDKLNTHEGAFPTWMAILINGLLFAGIVAGIAAQFTLGGFFAIWLGAMMASEDMKILFWALIIIGGLVVLGKLFGLDKK